jgi:hypothetical protein
MAGAEDIVCICACFAHRILRIAAVCDWRLVMYIKVLMGRSCSDESWILW